jgi:protein-disulfide isomerase
MIRGSGVRMAGFLRMCLLVWVVLGVSAAWAADDRMAERVLGKDSAPVRVDEFISLTCSHCAEFYNTTLPDLEKRYVDTGKVKFILHDFPLDGVSLKAAAVARCMPVDEYYPFVKTLYATQLTWAFGGGNPETNLIQYAKLGGLSEDKAKACANDTDLQNAIIAERTEAGSKYNIEATPTFVINNGAEVIKGAQSADAFAAVFDRLLATRK